MKTKSPLLFLILIFFTGAVQCQMLPAEEFFTDAYREDAVSAYAPNCITTIFISGQVGVYCPSNSYTFLAVVANGPAAPVYEWKLNGVVVGGNNNNYTGGNFSNNDILECSVNTDPSCGNNPARVSATLIIHVENPIQPDIAISTATTQFCDIAGEAIFNTWFYGGGTSPNFQWLKNGVNIGSNAPTYHATGIVNGDQFQCIFTSNASCASPLTAVSNIITFSIISSQTPSIQISASQQSACVHENIVFTAQAQSGGTAPHYQWKKNGNNVGTDAAVYQDNNLADNDEISCVLTSNQPCATVNTVSSNIVVIDIVNEIFPAVTISTDAPEICDGANVIFEASTQPATVATTYQWLKNGLPVGTNSSLYADNNLVNGDRIDCQVTATGSCGNMAVVSGNEIVVNVKPVVTPSIAITTSQTSICPKKELIFETSISNGGSIPSFQWQINGNIVGSNENTLHFSGFQNGDLVNCLLTSSSVCATAPTVLSNSIALQVSNIPLPVSLGKDSFVCTNFKNIITLRPSPSYNINTWQDGTQDQSFEASRPGIYYVTVQNEDGCTGADTIQLFSKECIKGFYMPTAFTPNGDGQNNFCKPLLFGNISRYEFVIYNRWGEIIFRTQDIRAGWDGRYKGVLQHTQTYIWTCTYQEMNGPIRNEKGHVTLLR